jgi:hypothetical protein
MKSFFEPIEKYMKIMIGSWNESSLSEILRVVVMTANSFQSINMQALDRLQKQLEKLESQLKGAKSYDTKKNRKSLCKTQ